MDWLNIVLILGIIGLIGVIIVGGKFKASKDGVEVDTDGLLKWLREAENEKQKNMSGGQSPRAKSVAVAPTITKIRKVPRASLLWVDDRPINNLFEKQAFASIGVFADSYENNDDAIRAASLVKYEAVISDIGRDSGTETGWDLLARLRAEGHAMPLIFYTGDVTADLRAEAKRRGATAITADPSELLRLINESLSS